LSGVGYALAAASVFSVNTNLARLAFAGGSDAPTLNAVRFAFTVVVLLIIAALRRRSRKPLTPRQRLAAAALGVLFFLCSFGYMGAIQYIPVSIAVLLLYSYPALVGLMARVSECRPLGLARTAALLLAFAGVALALGVDRTTELDWRGVALACLAAGSMALLVTGSSRVLREADHGEVNLHLTATAAVLFLAALAFGGKVHWPESGGGWLAFGGVLVTFAACQLTLIAAIGRAGPVPTAAVMNLEPPLTIGLAVLLVGERLTPLQMLGAVLVVAALFVMSRGRPRPIPAAEP
ncbi:MAG: DMT family transporter, partial [Alphaproteobacteria bacterium]